MSTTSARGEGRGRATADVRTLPNELLLAIWEELPPLERVCLSQVCRRLRDLALSTPKIWTSLAVVTTASSSALPASTPNAPHSVYHPRPNSDNLALVKKLLVRSNSLPLDLVVVLVGVDFAPHGLRYLLRANRRRLSRLHFPNGPPCVLNHLLRYCKRFPALRMLTGGFDNCNVVYAATLGSPPCAASPALPFLSQIHLGVEASKFIDWEQVSLPSIRELTITPHWREDLASALRACPNVEHVTVIWSLCSLLPRLLSMPIDFPRDCRDALVRIPCVCLSDMPVTYFRELLILELADDARYRNLRMEYARARHVLCPWPEIFLNWCDPLEGPLRLSVRLRAGAHEIEFVDRAGRRREISAQPTPPPLWTSFLQQRTISAAQVDARAWAYFAAGVATIPVADLTLVVAQDAAELDGVSLSALPALSALRVAVLHPRVHFSRAVLERLVGSRPATRAHSVLPMLALAPGASVEDETALATLAVVLKR